MNVQNLDITIEPTKAPALTARVRWIGKGEQKKIAALYLRDSRANGVIGFYPFSPAFLYLSDEGPARKDADAEPLPVGTVIHFTLTV